MFEQCTVFARIHAHIHTHTHLLEHHSVFPGVEGDASTADRMSEDRAVCLKAKKSKTLWREMWSKNYREILSSQSTNTNKPIWSVDTNSRMLFWSRFSAWVFCRTNSTLFFIPKKNYHSNHLIIRFVKGIGEKYKLRWFIHTEGNGDGYDGHWLWRKTLKNQ